VLAAACGDGEVTASGGGSPAYDHPTGPDDVVLEVAEEGGSTMAGPAAGTLREALAAANLLTRYAQADVVDEVWTRQLLPSDDGCPPGALPAA
jgi:hypothetical protein